MGSYFHDWIDYNGVASSIGLLEWGRTFSDFLGKDNLRTRMFVLQMKSKVFFIQFRKWVNL